MEIVRISGLADAAAKIAWVAAGKQTDRLEAQAALAGPIAAVILQSALSECDSEDFAKMILGQN